MSVLPTNGLLTRIDTISGVDVAGAVSFATGDAIAAECVIDEPTSSQRFVLGAAIADVSAVIYVALDDLPAGQQLQQGFRLVANQDGEESIVYRVIKRQLRVFFDITHFELFCKVA